MLVVWRIVERVGRRHRLAADAAGSGVCAAIAVIGCTLDVVCAVMLRNLGRFDMPTVCADAAFIKVMFFDAGHCITAGAGPLVTGFIQGRRLDLAEAGVAMLEEAVLTAP